jgi:hypothetical protein
MLRNKFNPLYSAAVDAPPANSGAAPSANNSESPAETKPEEVEPEIAPEPEPEPAPTPAPEANGKLSAFERTKLRMLGSGDLVSRVEKAERELASAQAEITRLNAENQRLSQTVENQNTELPKKVAAAAKGRENEVAKGVRNELTSLGISEAEAPAQINADSTPEAMLEKFATLKGSEKTAFFRANKTVLKAAEAAKSQK